MSVPGIYTGVGKRARLLGGSNGVALAHSSAARQERHFLQNPSFLGHPVVRNIIRSDFGHTL
jgi:hypothetical protein